MFKNKKKIEKLKKNNLFIWDTELNLKFNAEFFFDEDRVSIIINKKYTKNINEELILDEHFKIAFNYNDKLFYVMHDEAEDDYYVNKVKFSMSNLFNFVYNEMENYDFSENDIKLAILMLNDFIYPFSEKNEMSFSKEKNISVQFIDGVKEVSLEKLALLQSDFVNGMVENLKNDEIIDIFSELTFSEFKKMFCKRFRANSHTEYFLLHKISSIYFSYISCDFIKKIFEKDCCLSNSYFCEIITELL